MKGLAQKRTCLDCGFLTIHGNEMSQAERIMIGTGGQSAVMPAHCEQTQCFKYLWVDYDLTYLGETFEGVVEEIRRNRDECPGFSPYEAGLTPDQHLENQIAQRKEKTQVSILTVGTAINSPIQQGGAHAKMTQTISYTPDELNELRHLIEVFDTHLDDLALDSASTRKAKAQVATIKAQLDDKPDPVIVKQAGRTLRNITEGAIGSLIATATQPTVWTWAALIIAKLFSGP